MNERELKQECLKLMETTDAAYLGTIDGDGFPQTRAMLNLRNKKQFGALATVFEGHGEDFLTYFTTNSSSTKMSQIKTNPKVSAYFCSPGTFHGLMLGGNIEVVVDRELKKGIWQDGWEMYYPGGADDPEHTILRLLPAFGKGWRGEGPFEFELR